MAEDRTPFERAAHFPGTGLFGILEPFEQLVQVSVGGQLGLSLLGRAIRETNPRGARPGRGDRGLDRRLAHVERTGRLIPATRAAHLAHRLSDDKTPTC